jgi:hypothetical protein
MSASPPAEASPVQFLIVCRGLPHMLFEQFAEIIGVAVTGHITYFLYRIPV